MKRGTLKNIAAFCRITPQHFSDILGRRKRPSFRLAVALEEYTSVSRVTWVWGQRHELREALEEACREEKIGRYPSASRNQTECAHTANIATAVIAKNNQENRCGQGPEG